MILLCLALVWLAGSGVVRLLFPAPIRWSLHNGFLLALGSGIGMGIASALYFLCLAIAGPKVVVLAAVEAAALVAVVTLGIIVKRRGTILEWAPGPAAPWYLSGLLALAAATAVTMFLVYASNKPHGEWDAWSIWNLRARFLFLGGDFWKDAFSNQLGWSHPDYPLMLPGIIALCWTFARADSTLAPIGVAFLFTFGAAGVLLSTLGILRGKTQAFIAGILILGTASFVSGGATQYADIPLSFFILATLALLCLQDRYPEDPRFTLLAGLAAGLAAWTKNEGLLFVAAVVAARALVIVRYGHRAGLGAHLLRLVTGLLPPLMVVAFFKLRFAPANDLLSTQPHQVGAHLADFGRWITVLEGFVKASFRLGSFLIPIILLLALYGYLVRFNVEDRQRLSLATVLTTLGLVLIGDFVIYILFPADVTWQLNTSLERLFLQLWPAGLLAFFLAANPPRLVADQETAETAKPSKRGNKPARRTAETR